MTCPASRNHGTLPDARKARPPRRLWCRSGRRRSRRRIVTGRVHSDEIRDDILGNGVSDRGVLRRHYATDALDASTLLAAIFGFLDVANGSHLGNFPQASRRPSPISP